jgi:signal transduction histidine kinase/ligand-binding sensor domain-containing protein
VIAKPLLAAAAVLCLCGPLWPLDSGRSLTQYSRTRWTQEHGLPQDTIRAITQTSDGHLWLGTDEGLARFDGYEFVVFTKAHGDLPADSVTALAPARDGSLWIGTPNGLVQYRDGQFRTLRAKDGLPDDAISDVFEDRAGTLWVVSGVSVCRLRGGKFQILEPGKDLPTLSARIVREGSAGTLWLAGLGAVSKMVDGKFVSVLDSRLLDGLIVTAMAEDRQGNMWLGGSRGVLRIAASGSLRRYGTADGLPDLFVRALRFDRDGSLWVGTNSGLARLEGSRFVSPREDEHNPRELVRCLLEDRDGNLWVGASNGLLRLRDSAFTGYGRPEGLPSDEANAVFQDREGRMWVGFHDSGLMLLAGKGERVYTVRDGLPNDEVFSIRQARNGDLLLAVRGGMARMHDGNFSIFVPPDPLGRLNVFDVIEDSAGRVWMGTAGGLIETVGDSVRMVVPSAPLLVNAFVVLCEGRGGVLWAGTYGRGLWRIEGDKVRQFTTIEGLPSDQVRSLYQDPDGTLWIGTFGGGLASYRNGAFQKFSARDGLLSDNIANLLDDGESLWLGTTRGICRIAKQQLRDFAAGRRSSLAPVNYGVGDGLRSAQCAPGYPVGGGGYAARDGRMWFTTGRGLAVWDPAAPRRTAAAPPVRLVETSVNGTLVDLERTGKLQADSSRVQFRYGAISLSAPELTRYSYRLSGVDRDWVSAGTRRTINYNSLAHGRYVFSVRAENSGGPASERSYPFEVLPRFYETAFFRLAAAIALAAAVWCIVRLRLRQLRGRFAFVLEERARLAREIHDTLAQGFVGISSQLDAVAMCLPDETAPARKYLDLARKMARHSLTEARRSVMDLRASDLDGHDLPAALTSGTRVWTAGSGVAVDVSVTGEAGRLPDDVEQHLLRIAQEAVTNVVKHAGARRVSINLHTEARLLNLRVKDDGRGFEPSGAFAALGGHFGLLGMRERAERLGGELLLQSHVGEGTEVVVKVPLP